MNGFGWTKQIRDAHSDVFVVFVVVLVFRKSINDDSGRTSERATRYYELATVCDERDWTKEALLVIRGIQAMHLQSDECPGLQVDGPL